MRFWHKGVLQKLEQHLCIHHMSTSLLTSASSAAELEKSLNDVKVDPNRKYSVFKHRKKQAANESQLLM